jgi:hypothetical protein
MKILICKCAQCRGANVGKKKIVKTKRSGARALTRAQIRTGRWDAVSDAAVVGYVR